jgi:heterodisulfide reductase subunit A-like polyferredoxin
LKNGMSSNESIDNLQFINGGAMTNKSGSVMVVGAGIAGMQAALDLANSDYKVYLVDKSPTVGGMMSRLDKTFPTNDCAM